MLVERGFVSRMHRKKPKGKATPERTRIANAQKLKIRSAVEHVFAHQKGLMGMCARTIDIKQVKIKISITNLTYNIYYLG